MRLLFLSRGGARRYLEGDARRGVAAVPAADREALAADLPDVGAAPLHHMRRGGQRGAKGVEFVAGHAGAPREVSSRRDCSAVAAVVKPASRLRGVPWSNPASRASVGG